MKKIFQRIKELFNKSLAFVRKYTRPSVETVQLLKLALDSPIPVLLTALIPGKVDDVIVAQIKVYLPKILIILGLADACNKEGMTNDEFVQCAIEYIKKLAPVVKHAAYLNIASLLSKYLSDGRLSWSESIHLSEEYYKQVYLMNNLKLAA